MLAWLERLKSNQSTTQGGGGTGSFLSPGSARLRSPPSDVSSEPGPGSDLSDIPSGSGRGSLDSEEDSLGAAAAAAASVAADGGISNGASGPMTDKNLIPDPTVPVGLFANLSLSATRRGARARAAAAAAQQHQGLLGPEGANEDDDVGVANETYFMPGAWPDL